MKKISIIVFFNLINLQFFCQDSISVSGYIFDQFGNTIAGVSVKINSEFRNVTVLSNDLGFYFISKLPKGNFYGVSVSKLNYFESGYDLNFDSTINNSVSKNFILRERKNATVNSNAIKRKHLGITVSDAINKFDLDTLEADIYCEPPGKCHGFYAELKDSSFLFIHAYHFSGWNPQFIEFYQEQITGYTIIDKNCQIKKIGDAFLPRSFRNKYCKLEGNRY